MQPRLTCRHFSSQFCRGWESEVSDLPLDPRTKTPGDQGSSPLVQRNPALSHIPGWESSYIMTPQPRHSALTQLLCHFVVSIVFRNVFHQPQVDGWIYELHPIIKRATGSAGRSSPTFLYLCRWASFVSLEEMLWLLLITDHWSQAFMPLTSAAACQMSRYCQNRATGLEDKPVSSL